jgi:hypothetical protein
MEKFELTSDPGSNFLPKFELVSDPGSNFLPILRIYSTRNTLVNIDGISYQNPGLHEGNILKLELVFRADEKSISYLRRRVCFACEGVRKEEKKFERKREREE